MDKIQFGVAGLGRIGWGFHVKTLAAHADGALCAVMDVEEARRREAVDEHGCAAYDDYDAMLRHPGLQAVVVATPTHLHKEMALKAFARGLHVVVEKPMALDKAEAAVIVAAARAAGRVLTVYQPHRLAAYFQHLRRIVQEGKIGRVFWVRRTLSNYARRNDWQSLRKFGGGMLGNYGAHAVDQVLGLIGFDVQRVRCALLRVASVGDAEDVVKVVLESGNGTIGEVDVNQASVLKPYDMLAWGTRGGIILNQGKLTVRAFDPEALPVKEVDERLASAGRKYPSDQIDCTEETFDVDPSFQVDLFADFAACIRTGRTPAVPPEESLAVMDVLDRCRADAGEIRDFGTRNG